MSKNNLIKEIEEKIAAIDLEHSKRFIALDPNGYFLIKFNNEL